MRFNNIMHIAFFTDNIDEMVDFYQNKLGATPKVVCRYKAYLDRPDRPRQQEIARTDPERIFNAYFEIAPGQFIELFPSSEGQSRSDAPWNSQLGYTHFALTVDDIHVAYDDFVAAGIVPDTPASKGPSGTWQFWVSDPDGNKFEVMQYTEDSYQVTGHFD